MPSKQLYLITDPCYLMTSKEWTEYGDKRGWDVEDWELPIITESKEKII